MKQDMEHTQPEDFPPESDAAPASPPGVGPQLRAAREKKGLTVEQVAAQTRIPQHQIEFIEAGQFSRLAGRTYAVGFARNLAKVVDLDQNDVAAMVRHELDIEEGRERPAGKTFEPGDSDRGPSGALVWFSVFAILLLLIGLFFAARLVFAPSAELPSLVDQQRAEQAALAAADDQRQAADEPAPATGPVVFTATQDGIWVRFYTGDGNRLMEKELALGESYTVPADAVDPQLWTGRPEALAITVGGRQVPRLAEEDQVMRDVPVTAEALLARLLAAEPDPVTAAEPAVVSSPAAAPAPSATRAAPAPRPSTGLASPSSAPTRLATPPPAASPTVSGTPNIDALDPRDPLDPDTIPGAGAN